MASAAEDADYGRGKRTTKLPRKFDEFCLDETLLHGREPYHPNQEELGEDNLDKDSQASEEWITQGSRTEEEPSEKETEKEDAENYINESLQRAEESLYSNSIVPIEGRGHVDMGVIGTREGQHEEMEKELQEFAKRLTLEAEEKLREARKRIAQEKIRELISLEYDIKLHKLKMEAHTELSRGRQLLEKEKRKLSKVKKSDKSPHTSSTRTGDTSSARTRDWVNTSNFTNHTNTNARLNDRASQPSISSKSRANLTLSNKSCDSAPKKGKKKGGTKGSLDVQVPSKKRESVSGKMSVCSTSNRVSHRSDSDHLTRTRSYLDREETLSDATSGMSMISEEESQSSNNDPSEPPTQPDKGAVPKMVNQKKRGARSVVPDSSNKSGRDSKKSQRKTDVHTKKDGSDILFARVAREMMNPKSFSSGKILDYMEFTEQWRDAKVAWDPLNEKQKYRYLLDHLEGKPKKRALVYSGSETAFKDAWKDLEEFYGSAKAVYVGLIEPLRQMQPFVMTDYHALFAYGGALIDIKRAMRHCKGVSHYIYNDFVLADEIARKLPELRLRDVYRYVRSQGLDAHKDLTLDHLVDWWKIERKELGDPERYVNSSKAQAKKSDNPGTKQKSKKDAPKGTGIYATGAESPPAASDPKQDSPPTGKTLSSAETKVTVDISKSTCIFCEKKGHRYYRCIAFRKAELDEKIKWFQAKARCPKCALSHSVTDCKMDQVCQKCNYKHYNVLHDIVTKLASENALQLYHTSTKAMPIRPAERPRDVLLKVVKAVIHGPTGSEDCHILLDDGAERSLLLYKFEERLGIDGPSETLKVETVARKPHTWPGKRVSFTISPAGQPHVKFAVNDAYSSPEVCLHNSYMDLTQLQKEWPHLQGLPSLPDGDISPALLLASDHVDLISPLSYRLGLPGAPRGVQTLLGWSIQGNLSTYSQQVNSKTLANDFHLKCLNTATTPISMGGFNQSLYQMVERLWKMESLVSVSEKEACRSRMDKRAVAKLEQETYRESVDGVLRYHTPLLWIREDVKLFSQPKAVIPRLRSLERKCIKEPKLAEAFNAEVTKLLDAGLVRKLTPVEISKAHDRVWYIPSHVVWAHEKARLVFDCSFEHEGVSVNSYLQPGPTLCSTLLGVILRFRQYPVALSADVKAMFHQVRLKPEDRPVFRFLWRNMQTDVAPSVYEWQVLPFGATCSPCCASFALLKHTKEHGTLPEQKAMEEAVYVDNLLVSYPDSETARDVMQSIIRTGTEAGFEWRKIASNDAESVKDIPETLLSDSSRLSLDLECASQEPALGLSWNREEDNLVIAIKFQDRSKHTKRTVLQDLASYSFDPPGFLSPFTVRAKVIMQDLWKLKLDWDEGIPEGELKEKWLAWRAELKEVSEIKIPRCYSPPHITSENARRELHIF